MMPRNLLVSIDDRMQIIIVCFVSDFANFEFGTDVQVFHHVFELYIWNFSIVVLQSNLKLLGRPWLLSDPPTAVTANQSDCSQPSSSIQ